VFYERRLKMRTSLILIILFTAAIKAQQSYELTPGVKGNQIVLQIVNTSETETASLPIPLQRRGLKNLTFRDVSKETITLKPKEEKEIKYTFDVDYNVDITKADTVEFLITDNRTIHLTKQFIFTYTQPKEFRLEQNYPNPFNPATRIRYTVAPPNLPKGEGLGKVTLKVYDILGNEVTTLVNEAKEPGYYEVEWDASRLASGVYIYRLTSGQFVSSKKMMLIR
jgi:hypothetical protein